MKLDEIEIGLKEVAEMLRQVKHYVTKNNIPLPNGMPPVLALMCHHENLENELRQMKTALTKVSNYTGRLEHSIAEMVNLLTNVEQARAMATVGTQWLMDNAPSELTHPWQMYLVAKKQNDEMASLLADINEYCQANGVGTIGDSASKALMTHHKALIEGKLVPVYQCREIAESEWMACDLKRYQYCQQSPEHDTRIIYVQTAPLGTPLGGTAIKDPSKCRAEGKGECGCAFGQCANGLVY